MLPNIRIGTLTGNGSTQVVNIGFVPDYVKIVNVTDRDEMFEWFTGMSDGTAVRCKGPASGPESLTSNGIGAVNNATDGVGFQFGNTISENGKSLRYLAVRNGPGV